MNMGVGEGGCPKTDTIVRRRRREDDAGADSNEMIPLVCREGLQHPGQDPPLSKGVARVVGLQRNARPKPVRKTDAAGSLTMRHIWRGSPNPSISNFIYLWNVNVKTPLH